MVKFLSFLLVACPIVIGATEALHPQFPPATGISIDQSLELDDDVYSTDLTVSGEYAFSPAFSIYADASFRFLSYSYEYSTKGYIHNYCNLHVNGFNETYIGAKALLYRNAGLNIGWRFPPGEGSQKDRFHRLNIEPFTFLHVSRRLLLATSLRYNLFLEESNYKPGDEIGFTASFSWKPFWNFQRNTGWEFTETFLYQYRINESENRNLEKPWSKMDDKYKGMKIKFDLARSILIYSKTFSFGAFYEIHKGTLFGFETGHKIGFKIKVASN